MGITMKSIVTLQKYKEQLTIERGGLGCKTPLAYEKVSTPVLLLKLNKSYISMKSL